MIAKWLRPRRTRRLLMEEQCSTWPEAIAVMVVLLGFCALMFGVMWLAVRSERKPDR